MENNNKSDTLTTEPECKQYKYQLVLLIDDNYIDNFISEKMLTALSFSKETHFAINGQLALDLLSVWSDEDLTEDRKYPDIIFVDLNMPVMNGIEFIREFQKSPKNAYKKPKVIVLTSSIHDTDKSEVLKIDSSIVFLRKPLTNEVLNSL